MLKYHIQTIEVGSGGAADITFNNIPQIYDDLYVVLSVKAENTDNGLFFKFNNTTANTSWRNLLGYGTGVLSQSGTGWLAGGGVRSTTASTYGSVAVTIPSYRSTTTYKTASVDSISEANESTAYQFIVANQWSDYSAINSITFYLQSGELDQYSSASLYGIKRGFSGELPTASGGTITTSGGYTIHTFNSSGTFTANRNITADILVIAGGGGGGSDQGGGGGAGGYIEQSLSLTPSPYAVTVGAGGTGMSGTQTGGTSGSNSVFATITSTGGGKGGNGNADSALTGGSGGGGGSQLASQLGKAGTASQGFAGANGSAPNAGGGGGAGEAGNTDGSRAGGDGVSSSITGSAVIRAGGGSGGSNNGSSVVGGDGGGGTGTGNNTNGGAGTANTGGGGGGGGSTPGVGNGNGGNGGSGVVIIRYPTP